MAMILTLFISALILTGSVQCAKDDKHVEPETHPSCEQFTRGLTFNNSDALGTWHLLHYKTETDKGSADSHCVEFTLLTDQERMKLSNAIGLFAFKETIALKMQIPCSSANASRARDYYLERLGSDGSYGTLQLPPPSATLEIGDIRRHPMRLKMVEGSYMGMMDCHEKFVFLLGKQPASGRVDDRLKNMIDTYWPEEE